MQNFLTAFDFALRILSGEFLLKSRANGSAVIVARSVIIACIIECLYVAIKHSVDPDRAFQFSALELRREISGSLPILGASFAAAYASLYARFASQWTYLANLYNQIMAAIAKGDGVITESVGTECRERSTEVDYTPELAHWIASFIEDAEELHLITKKNFGVAVIHWLKFDEVRAAYDESTVKSCILRSEKLLKKLEAHGWDVT